MSCTTSASRTASVIFHAENPWDPVSDGPDPSVSHYYDGYGAGWEEAAYE